MINYLRKLLCKHEFIQHPVQNTKVKTHTNILSEQVWTYNVTTSYIYCKNCGMVKKVTG